ncbi:MAG: four helix bundle protein [Patescibacteria group bacterium]
MDNKIRSFKDLNVWKEGHKLVLDIYKITKTFPKDELFGLTNQIRRAAVSITSNISEGFNRISHKEKLQFYFIALGSLAETQNQLLIAKDTGYIKPEIFDKIELQLIVVQRLLNGFIKSTRMLQES